MNVGIAGVGAWGPGFSDWNGLSAWLRNGMHDKQPNQPGDIPGRVESGPLVTARPAPECIPPRERRRAPLSVKLAVAVAEQACIQAGIDPDDAVSVFASGMGDMDITDYMCRTLASDHPMISPTKFHNSVHNAPVGYWSISQGARRSSNAVAGFTHSVPVSLLEAVTQCATESVPVLWASQDITAPEPFRVIADIPDACAFALLLTPDSRGTSMEVSLKDTAVEWPEGPLPELAALYGHNPTARLLPLLKALAAGGGTLMMPLNDHLALSLAVSDVECEQSSAQVLRAETEVTAP